MYFNGLFVDPSKYTICSCLSAQSASIALHVACRTYLRKKCYSLHFSLSLYIFNIRNTLKGFSRFCFLCTLLYSLTNKQLAGSDLLFLFSYYKISCILYYLRISWHTKELHLIKTTWLWFLYYSFTIILVNWTYIDLIMGGI